MRAWVGTFGSRAALVEPQFPYLWHAPLNLGPPSTCEGGRTQEAAGQTVRESSGWDLAPPSGVGRSGGRHKRRH